MLQIEIYRGVSIVHVGAAIRRPPTVLRCDFAENRCEYVTFMCRAGNVYSVVT